MRKLVICSILMLGAVAPGYSQFLSFGIKGGVPLNDALNAYNSNTGTVSTSTEHWLVGPTVEVHLPFRLSVEADAIYRSESYVASGTAAINQGSNLVSTVSNTFNSSLNDWQFPILAKYELHGGVVRPFIDGGLTYRHLSGGGPINNANSAGVTFGGGITLKVLFFRLSPEIRYTRWGSADVNPPYVTNSQNQADLLVGFVF